MVGEYGDGLSGPRVPRSQKPLASLLYVGRGKAPRRSATCPDHNKRTSEFRGEQQEMFDGKRFWAFRCSERNGHIFLADIPRDAPRSVAAAAAWMEKHEAEAAGVPYDSGGR